jgi:DNA-binding transcriptional regulator YiaG
MTELTGEKLRQIRRNLHESQEEFAKRFDCHQTTIHDWEVNGPPKSGPVRKVIDMVVAQLPTAEVPPTQPEAPHG